MGTILQDIRYGLRMLLKSPSVSIVATIALALGIGANTAIFSVVNAVLLRPLPYPNSEALMSVFEKDQSRGVVNGSYSYPNFFDLREQHHVFDHIADIESAGRAFSARDRASQARHRRSSSTGGSRYDRGQARTAVSRHEYSQMHSCRIGTSGDGWRCPACSTHSVWRCCLCALDRMRQRRTS